MVILGVALLWPGPGSESPPAAVDTTPTKLATTTTTMSESTTSLAGGIVPGVLEGGREACPVTAPGDGPFTPEAETPDGPPPSYQAVWYGTPELWTMVHSQGQDWVSLPVGADGSLTQKTFWWSDDFVLGEELEPDITVTAEHLDGSAPTLEAGGPGTNGSHPELGNFMIVGLEIPDEGCWRITAEYRETTLSYVAWVDVSSPGAGSDLSATTVALLDGSDLEIVGPAGLKLAGFLFTLESPRIGSSNVSLSPGVDPADSSMVDQAAVLESNLGEGVRLWRADREGRPFFMTVDLGGWVALLHVGNQTAPRTEDLLSVADQLSGATGQRGVILSNYSPDVFTTYLEDPNTANQIHLGANQCIRERVPGADVVEDPTRGELIRGPEYVSWCEQAANIEVMVYGDEQFVERVVAELTLGRHQPQQP